MASSDYSCSINQGYNFVKDSQVHVGYITALSIGGTALAADTGVTDPTNISGGSASLQVVGVISDISWDGGYAQPVYVTFHVSNTNKVSIATMVHKDLSNTQVSLGFTVYEFDPVALAYFPCFTTDTTPLSGLVLKDGSGQLALAIANQEDGEVPSPKNFVCQLGFMPGETAQVINLAFSSTQKFAKTIGVPVSGS